METSENMSINKQTLKGKKQDRDRTPHLKGGSVAGQSVHPRDSRENVLATPWAEVERAKRRTLEHIHQCQAKICITSVGDLNVQPHCSGTAIKDKNSDHCCDYDSNINQKNNLLLLNL